jgi:hypothetical protein
MASRVPTVEGDEVGTGGARAGCVVRGGSKHVRKEVAETSTLYWAYWRKNRRCLDLSEGWGSNSSWATEFRLDYRFGDRFHYNVDGEADVHAPRPDPDADPYRDALTVPQRIELLTHRCRITFEEHDDLWIWDDTYQETWPPQGKERSA